MWLILIFIIIVCIYLLYQAIEFWIINAWRVHRDLATQGVPGRNIPFVGDLLLIRQAILAENPLLYSMEAAVKFGDYYRMSLGPIPGLNISDPSMIDGVLKSNVRCYQKSVFMQSIIGRLIGTDNLLMGENEVHARHRRLISPVFQHQNVHSMQTMMIDIASSIFDSWEERALRNENHELVIDIREEMSRLTLSVVTGCLFGKSISTDRIFHEKIYRNVKSILKEIEQRLFNVTGIIPWIDQLPLPSKLRIDKSMQELRSIVECIIDERKKCLTQSIAKGPDLLDQVDRMTMDETFGEALTFIIAGHETTSSLMTWTLYNLALYSDIYRRCQSEVDCTTAFSALPYVEMVLKESLRLYPPIPLLPRTAVKDNILTTVSGNRIYVKQGTEVIVNLYTLHHSKTYWSQPENFDPSRFSHQQSDKYLAFSTGVRSCIGQNFAMLEARILVAMILRRFHIELLPGQKHVPDIAVTLRPKHEMWMRLSLRNILQTIINRDSDYWFCLDSDVFFS